MKGKIPQQTQNNPPIVIDLTKEEIPQQTQNNPPTIIDLTKEDSVCVSTPQKIFNPSISRVYEPLESKDTNPSPIKLSIELVPKTSCFNNVRSQILAHSWKKLRNSSFKKVNGHCEICQTSNAIKIDEIWHYDDKVKIKQLLNLMVLCSDCHEVKHMDLAIKKFRKNEAKNHLAKVNHWDLDQAEVYIKECISIWRERSLHDWELDLSWLERQGIPLKNRANKQNHLLWEKAFEQKDTTKIKQMLDELQLSQDSPKDTTKIKQMLDELQLSQDSPIKLCIELVPKTCWFEEKNIRNQISVQAWNKLRNTSFKKANYHCQICQNPDDVSQLYCREIWHYDDQVKTRRLLNLMVLCSDCHEVKHDFVMKEFKKNKLTSHLAKVNHWDLDQAEVHIKECISIWRERSLHNWKHDLSWFEKQGIQLKLSANKQNNLIVTTQAFVQENSPFSNSSIDMTVFQSKTIKKTTCLHAAVVLGNFEILERLLTFTGIQALINDADRFGQTPLHIAVKKQKIEIVNLLFKHHADVNQNTTHKKNTLHYAVSNKNFALIEVILAQGGTALCHQYDGWDKLPIHGVFKIDREYFAKGIIQLQKILAIVGLLLPHLQESEIIKTDKYGKTLLHTAVRILPKEQLERLFKLGGDKVLLLADKYGKTVLHEAAKWGNTDAIHLILAYGGKILVNQYDCYGKSPLHEAAIWCVCNFRQVEMISSIKILLEQGAKWNQTSLSNNRTPFEELCESLDIVKAQDIFSPYLTPEEIKICLDKAQEKEQDSSYLSEKLFPTSYLSKRKIETSEQSPAFTPQKKLKVSSQLFIPASAKTESLTDSITSSRNLSFSGLSKPSLFPSQVHFRNEKIYWLSIEPKATYHQQPNISINQNEVSSVGQSKIGKWMLFYERTYIDKAWEAIQKAVREGHIWHAKVSTVNEQNQKHVLIVYTKDYTDVGDVIGIHDYLNELGLIKETIYYKTNHQTNSGIYRGNPHQKPWIYSSDTIEELRNVGSTMNNSEFSLR